MEDEFGEGAYQEEDEAEKGPATRKPRTAWKRAPLQVDEHAAQSNLRATATALAIQAQEEQRVKTSVGRAEKHKVCSLLP